MSGFFRHQWALIAALAGPLCCVQADTLYRWTDSEGQLHYGDRPPLTSAEQVEQLHMPAYSPPNPPVQEDPYSILNQVERLEAYRQNLNRERQEREQAQREYNLRKLELEARQEAQQAPMDTRAYGYPRPVYPRPPIHGPDWPFDYPRPPGLWKPDHPAFRPPGYPRPPVAVPYGSRGGAGVIVPTR
ncbi:MAG: DUF4124 domain-containing protein [Sedimenticolaceae bacterium]|jgi:hypothetical protein